MLPTTRIRPRVDLSRTLAKHHVSKPTQDVNRKHTPARAAFAPATTRVSAKGSVTPTRTSLDHGHGLPTPVLEAGDSSVSDFYHQTVSSSISGSTQSQLSNSASAVSLCGSDSELALLLSGADSSRPGCTTINIGSIPISVPIAYIDIPIDSTEQQPIPAEEPVAAVSENCESDSTAVDTDAARATKLNPTSAEFYPNAYIAAAAATALAAQSISSSSGKQIQSSTPLEVANEQTPAAVGTERQLEQQPSAQASVADQAPPQQQLVPVNFQQQQQQQQQLHTWQPQQQQWQPSPSWQQPMPMPVPMYFTVPVNYMVPAAYHYAWQQQQWQQQQHHMLMQQMQVMPTMVAPPRLPSASQDGSSAELSLAPPVSPAPSLPADTSSLMSAPSSSAAHSWALNYPGSYSARPGSSASSVVSAFAGSSRGRQQQDRLRDAGTVTVSSLSCVKDAAGALAKVVNRHGSCLLLSLTRQGDVAAQATHVAAKSLAVARFYINAHMAAEGSAGVDAAAVLSGVEQAADVQQPRQQQSTDEVVFMPYTRSSSSSRSTAAVDVDEPLGFMVAKASSKDLPVLLPPPVGIPACMQDRQQQQQCGQAQQDKAAALHAYQSAAPLLKAGANTDVNKLSNAIIHNILGCNHVALQLAGAAACHVAMKALIKARSRLQRKFAADIVATASFANEDTSSSIGRSTVFLRLDVLRSDILKHFADVGGAARAVASRAVSEVGESAGAPQ